MSGALALGMSLATVPCSDRADDIFRQAEFWIDACLSETVASPGDEED